MTRIIAVNGIRRPIPQDEWPDRGRAVTRPGYVPFAEMSAGQTAVALMKQRFETYEQFDPNPLTKKALQMLTQAEKSAVHGLSGFVGVIPDALQPLARFIDTSKRRTNATTAYNVAGIGAIDCREIALRAFKKKYPGQPQYVTDDRRGHIVANPLWVNFLRACENAGKDIEKIFNEYIPQCGHHVPYGMLSPAYYAVPGKVDTRRILHIGGIEGTAAINGFPKDLMYLWYDNAIIQVNAEKGAGVMGGWETSFSLAGANADAFIQKYQDWVKVPGRKPSPYIRGIGIAPAIVAAIISAIGTALASAASLIIALKNKPNETALALKGFGTPGFSASEGDWETAFQEYEQETQKEQNTMLLALAAAGAFFLLNDK